jgi:acylphosphatase
MPASPGDLKRVHIRVTGRVQGVGFRAYVADQFRFHGVKGWVRNIGYDQVEALAEGAEAALKAFAEAVVAGPRASRVDESQVDWESATGEFTDISVRASR